jgi:CRISPR-associated endonuclease/helicase Cas3
VTSIATRSSGPSTEKVIPWAKLRTDPISGVNSRHPLLGHCGDVAAVMEELLNLPTIPNRLAQAGGVASLDTLQRTRLVVLTFFHDLGKCNRGFQNKEKRDPHLPTAGHTNEALVLLGRDVGLTQKFIASVGWKEIAAWGGDATMLRLLLASLSHHGDPLVLDQGNTADARWWDQQALGDLRMLGHYAHVWWPEAWSANAAFLPDEPRFQRMFAGLVSLADWLGSNTEFFTFDRGDGSQRIEFAREAAANAVQAVGLRAKHIPSEAPSDFCTAFGFAPRPLQHVINQAPLDQIAILEGETGSGKTEAALWYWRRLHDAGLVDGLYFALPTRSAGVQIHERVTNALTKLWGAQAPVCVLAVPGYIRADDYQGHRLPGWEVLWDDNAQGAIRHERWAAEAPRRFLSAYVAVGTVDQALLSALRVTHSAQRASVLARSLLIVDEVHASDAYMGAILVRLVRHHVACGGYFLALSATLGASLRNALVVTPACDLPTSLNVAYPATHVGATVMPIPSDENRTVTLTIGTSDKADIQ